MRLFTISALALAIGFSGIPAPVLAQETVFFDTPETQPSAFRLRRAAAQGQVLEPTPGIRLEAVLRRPQTDNPAPAMVILPDENGLSAANLRWGEMLAEQGYVSLTIRSFASRGGTNIQDVPSVDIKADALAGLDYLATLDFVGSDRVGLLGFGRGGWFVQRTLDAALPSREEDAEFRVGIALYPLCDPETRLTAPLLILAGEEDNLTSVESCRAMAAANSDAGTGVDLALYPDATHFFDNPAYDRSNIQENDDQEVPIYYETNFYDADAHDAAVRDALAFLVRHLQ